MRISYKIFGVSLLVFAIMAASSVFSIVKIFEINRELRTISTVFAPLSHQIARIEAVALTEELHLERIEKLQAELRANRLEVLSKELNDDDINARLSQDPALQARIHHLETRLATEMQLFEDKATEVQGIIVAAEHLVRNAQSTVTSVTDRLELAALFPTLVGLEGQHSRFHTQAVNLVTAHGMPPALRERMEERLEVEEDALAKDLDAVREQVATFTDAAIETAALHEQQAFYASIGSTASAGVLALILSSLVIAGILKPMRALAKGANQVRDGDLTVQIPPRSRDEIGMLTTNFNAMVDGLKSTQKIKDTFGQYVDPRVVSGLIGERSEATMGEKKVVTAYFSDLADFTAISEQFTPAGLVRVLNRYLDVMSVPITERQGVIDKYIGDAIMAFWAAPFCKEGEQATLAVSAALFNQVQMAAFQAELPDLTGLQKNLPILHQRIGIATGDAVIGSIGSEKTKNYTVMGDTVNLGSRLEGANKVYGTSILVCERTADLTRGITFRPVDRLQVVGRTEPTRVFTPLKPESEMEARDTDLLDRTEAAFDAYSAHNWSEAKRLYGAIAADFAEDPIAHVFLNRLRLIDQEGVPDDWDGVWRLTAK